MVLPAWEAVIVHVPVVTNVAVEPETVQTDIVVEAKLTPKPELAEAVSVRGVPTFWVAIGPKVMVCVKRTGNVCETGVAAANVVLPSCEAVMVQLPPVAVSVAVVPLTVQTDCVVDE